MASNILRVIPLGGLGEIGKNMMVLELDNDMIVVDAGVMFPEEDMLGIDLVIPDISYILDRSHKLRSFIITHGHEDHTGALPYVLKQIKAPVYCSRLARGLIEVKLKEHKLAGQAEVRTVGAGERVRFGEFQVEFIQVAHSIPDSFALAISTPVGTVIHTGDFKLDYTPVMGQATDLARLARLGNEGVLLLLSDSTYAEISGYTQSEQAVGDALDRIIAKAPGRVIIATFASLISRIQQVIDAAARYDRRVFVIGRSMVDNVQMALEHGYLKAPEGVLGTLDDLRRTPDEKTVVVSTGSQGEPTSALVRMANNDHRNINIVEGDTVILSSTPIPGNEMLVNRTIDNLCRLGANVLHGRIADVHVRGHAASEELKLILDLVKPRFFVPVHGEYRHMLAHAKLAQIMNVQDDNIFVMEDGDVLELDGADGSIVERVPASHVYVDGLAVGVDQVVLRDRRHLSTDGIVVVIMAVDKQTGQVIGRPDIVTRGFPEVEGVEDVLESTRDVAVNALSGAAHVAEWSDTNTKVKDAVAQHLYDKIRRRPMILPMTLEV